MTRLTVHLEQPIFRETTPVNVGTKEAPRMKPKKRKCIQNTLSFKNITALDAKHILQRIRKAHGIATWTDGEKKGQEMIYIVH
tara:strand:- start:183 stop:431 length:249 start_codon:yes stop_codon:yes gene_type:complete